MQMRELPSNGEKPAGPLFRFPTPQAMEWRAFAISSRASSGGGAVLHLLPTDFGTDWKYRPAGCMTALCTEHSREPGSRCTEYRNVDVSIVVFRRINDARLF